MLSAVYTGKVHISPTEDTLTSSVFDNLLLLPDKIIWKIIRDSSFENNLPKYVGSIQFFKFWPHWDSIGTKNQLFVEPDLFISFDEIDLIIEAKRRDYNQQYQEQWEKEIISYKNEYKENAKKVYLLAIGGISNETEEDIKIGNNSYKIIKCRWKNILNYLQNLYFELDNCIFLENNNIKRIIANILTGFEIHGYLPITWFDDIKKYYHIKYDQSLNILKQWRL